jgi:hypothetical protein
MTISKTITGRRSPIKTMRLGVFEQSLKKHIINPIIPKIQTAIVPTPTPRTRPS